MNTCSISDPVNDSVTFANWRISKPCASRLNFAIWMFQMASRSSRVGRSTKNNSSQRPLRSISGGSWLTSLAVATMNTGVVFSCIQEMNEPKTREEADVEDLGGGDAADR